MAINNIHSYTPTVARHQQQWYNRFKLC